jgi:hypothetical protein
MSVIAAVTACVFMITTACSTSPRDATGTNASATCGGFGDAADGAISSNDATFRYHTDATSSVYEATVFGALFYHAETHIAPDLTLSTVRFGRAFPVREVTVRTTDGERMSGTIDGRPIAPFVKGQPWETVTMADGSPLPPLGPDPRARDALDALVHGAQAGGSACAVAGAANGETKIESSYTAPGHLSNTGLGYHPCNLCIDACNAIFTACGVTAAIAAVGCGPFYALCLAAGLVACGIALAACIVVCNQPGQACCPVSCGGGCCQFGESCLKPPTPLCCSAGTKACNGTSGDNCCNNSDNCLPDGSCCANGNPICLGNACCNPGDNCASAGQEGGDPNPCCPAKQVICNGTCCKAGESCIKGLAGPDHCGVCPPDPSVPGSGLCADNTTCCNAMTFAGTACAKFGPSPMSCCVPKTICDAGGTACCQGNQTCTGAPLKVTCCDDKNVCGANAETCCTDPINPCSTSDSSGAPVCCDTSVHPFCAVSGRCCDKPGTTCDAVGNCVP